MEGNYKSSSFFYSNSICRLFSSLPLIKMLGFLLTFVSLRVVALPILLLY